MPTPDPSMSLQNSSGEELLTFVRQIEALNTSSLNHRMGIEITEVSRDRIVGTMPVEGNTQPFGLLHGGASVVLAETLGSTGSALHAGPDRIVVGVDINATHHRAARSGLVTGVATPISLGNTLCSWEVVVSDEDGKRVCTSRITCLVRQRPPGS
ncbi:MAG TPA: hotdog fold thioesterase [Phycicoccus sp.]|nr:hotdog fold thioesterase [Phycicoccus sp.]